MTTGRGIPDPAVAKASRPYWSRRGGVVAASPRHHNPAVSDARINGIADAVVFACGLTYPVTVVALGTIFVGEACLIAYLLFMFVRGRDALLWRSRPIQYFIGTGLLLLAGLILADLYRGTSHNDLLRGWARVAWLLCDILALGGIALVRPRGIWWFVLGWGIGGVVVGISESTDVIANWKFGISFPITLLIICTAVLTRSDRVMLASLVAAGALNVALDYRSLGGFCIASAAVYWVRQTRERGARPFEAFLVFTAAVLAVAWLLGVFSLYSDDVRSRQEQSNTERATQIMIATSAIAESPILGYGSWARHAEFSRAYEAELEALTGGPARIKEEYRGVIPAHSQVLQAWIEAGILGLPFFLLLVLWLTTALARVAWGRSAFPDDAPLYIFLIITVLWAALFSPFAGGERVKIAIAIASLCVLRPQASVQRLLPATALPPVNPTDGVECSTGGLGQMVEVNAKSRNKWSRALRSQGD